MAGKNSRHEWKLEYDTNDPTTIRRRVYACSKCPAKVVLMGLENKSHIAEKARRQGLENCGLTLAKHVIET